MNESRFDQFQQENKVTFLEKPQSEPIQPLQPFSFDEYQPFLETLRRPKYHITTAPAFTPKNFLDSIQFYDDGINRRIYFYINNNWRYATLT